MAATTQGLHIMTDDNHASITEPFRVEPVGPTVSVVKGGEEGAIEIDARTGIITTPIDLRPDWADGLAVAMLAERVGFYAQRTGTVPPSPAVFEMSDLSWVGMDEEQQEYELEASPETRQEMLASMLGIDREDVSDNNMGKTLAEREIAMDTLRQPGEPQLLDAESRKSFGEVDLSVAHAKKDGTHHG